MRNIPNVVDIQIEGWKTAYKEIVDDSYLNSMNRDERIEKRKKFYTKIGGKIIRERKIEIGEEAYLEVGFIYNI